jgi:hypothetical protein
MNDLDINQLEAEKAKEDANNIVRRDDPPPRQERREGELKDPTDTQKSREPVENKPKKPSKPKEKKFRNEDDMDGDKSASPLSKPAPKKKKKPDHLISERRFTKKVSQNGDMGKIGEDDFMDDPSHKMIDMG